MNANVTFKIEHADLLD